MSLILIAAGAAVGYQLATRVQMTQMPELVAIMHSLSALPPSSWASTPMSRSNRVAGIFAEAGCPSRSPMDRFRRRLTRLEGFELRELIAKKTPVEIGILRVELFLGISSAR
jgi:NAD(P) transhydrogenase subunit beta